MSLAPGLHALDVVGAVEVIAIGRLGKPEALAPSLADRAAGRSGTKLLTPRVAGIRQEEQVAVETLA